MEQEATSIFKERFIHPELSIWDYLITKVIQKNLMILYLGFGIECSLNSEPVFLSFVYFLSILITLTLFFSLCYLHQKAELSMILRRATVVRMKMTMMSTKMHLTLTCHTESIQITIHTGNDAVVLTTA